MRPVAVAIVLLVLSVCVLAAQTMPTDALDWAARGAFVLLCFFSLAGATIREWILSAAAIGLAIVLARAGATETILAGLDLAAYFAAFILLLTALKISADRSTSVLNVGRYLIRQPANTRFMATATGGHILGVFLNFGAISLMAPLIQNAAKNDDGTVDTQMERRQLSALLRGFAWILLWAPTTLAQAVLLTLFTEIDLGKIIVVGLMTSVLMMLLGLVYDRIEWRNVAPPQRPVCPLPRKHVFRLAVVCSTLIVCTATLQVSYRYSTALSLMFVAPLVTVVWYAAQRREPITVTAHLMTFWPALIGDASGLARSAIALGLSGFIGRTTAEVVPVESLLAHVDLATVPGWLFLAALPVLITIGGQIALSPIILVVFIGQVVQMVPVLPADPTHIVFALSAGWAISMFASPNATATLLISATTRIAPTRLTWGWNLRYGLLAYLGLVSIFAILEAGVFG